MMRRWPFTGTLSLLSCLNHFLIDVTSFRLSNSLYSLSVPFNRTTNLVLHVQIVWIVEFTGPISRLTSAFFFYLFYISHISLTFYSALKTFLLFVTLVILSLCKSSVNRRSRKVEGNFTHKVNYRWDPSLFWNVMQHSLDASYKCFGTT
jgi:hypothetical protein